MLESYYKATYTLSRLRAGSTGPFVDGFATSTVRSHARPTKAEE